MRLTETEAYAYAEFMNGAQRGEFVGLGASPARQHQTFPCREADVKNLVEMIAKALVDNPDQVSVTETDGEQATVIELRVASGDLGKVIGKQGRTARCIRTLLGSAGMKQKKRFVLEILE